MTATPLACRTAATKELTISDIRRTCAEEKKSEIKEFGFVLIMAILRWSGRSSGRKQKKQANGWRGMIEAGREQERVELLRM